MDFCAIFDTAYNNGHYRGQRSSPPQISWVLGPPPAADGRRVPGRANSGQQCTPPVPSKSVTDRDENVSRFSADWEVISADVANKTAALLTASAGQYYTSARLGDGRPLRRQVGYDRRPRSTMADGLHPLSSRPRGWARRELSQEVGSVTINGKYYGEIYGETFVGQNILGTLRGAGSSPERRRERVQREH